MEWTIWTAVELVIAICIIGTGIWAFQKFVAPLIPAPFGWVGGLIIFVAIILACYFLWDELLGGGGHFSGHRHSLGR